MTTAHNDGYYSHHHLGMTKEKTMKKTSIGFVVGILAITALILMSGIALANNTTNDTNATDTNVTVTPTTTGTVVATETVTAMATTTATETIEEPEVTTPEETEQSVTPVKTTKPEPTKSPGFGSIIAIVTMLSAIYIFRMNRK